MKTTSTLAAAALLLVSIPSVGLAASAPPMHVRGTISKLTPTAITVTTAKGPVVLPYGAKTRIVGVVPASESDITTGTFIGTANLDSASGSRAQEVVVFPAAMKGTGEGNYAWDLPASGGHSMMTNGTVAGNAPAKSMMTNATVSHMSGGATKTVVLTYKGGRKTVTIPANVPVVRMEPGSKSMLAVGKHVVAVPGTAGGKAKAVIVGQNGAVPPM